MVRLFSDRGKRRKWEAGLAWFRLRYRESPARAINLLSRPAACGRVALYFQPGRPISRLYLGVPEGHTRLLERMAVDFNFVIVPERPQLPALQPMTAVADLSWDTAFVAHIANEFVFAGGEYESGPYLPQPPSVMPGRGPAAWRLPAGPQPGLTLDPSWENQRPPLHLVAGEYVGRWPLGWSGSGVPLQAAGRVNVYGRREMAAEWLAQQVAQMVALDHANLVVIDGAGDLAPRLKRKAAVTRLLGKGLAYLDLDGPPLAGGFNPLASAPGETEAALVRRWRGWFEGMNVHPEAIQLLAQARRDGVGDISALGKWLKRAERQGQQTATSAGSVQAVSSLSMALNRLTADRGLREWLAWPDNRFEILPEGALFFSCKNLGWDRQQLLRAVLSGVTQVKGVRLVVHGLPWQGAAIDSQEQIVVSNGPLLAGSARVLVASKPAAAARLADLFLNGDSLLAENLEILPPGQAILVVQDDILPISWTKDGRI